MPPQTTTTSEKERQKQIKRSCVCCSTTQIPIHKRQKMQSLSWSTSHKGASGCWNIGFSEDDNPTAMFPYDPTNGSSPTRSQQDDGDNKLSDILAPTAKDLNAMSLTDREKLFEEVNGIPAIVDEEPEFVTHCLTRLEEEIPHVPLDKSAYHLAMALCPQLKMDRDFRLLFLRSECFHPRKAARCMVKYLDSKQMLFGEDKVVKQITYDDLTEDDEHYLLSGTLQVLPSRDQTGRTIVFFRSSPNNHRSWKNQVRKRRW